MLYKKQSLTIVKKVNDHYIVTKAEFVGVGVKTHTATFDFTTDTATFIGRKLRTRDIDRMFKAVKAHYSKRIKF